ncbi:cytochrome ubiquinol oxidase subunit I [Antribacter gilvus]|uniref:cytochrome ubiquinol oxidase subunit I n=1 Tax=Antribacter gilvus TaxID=2304675 RepID=UPI000F79B2C6|nr:cytochrome ubiquinol oxidase subunit I [Antribacter gilvus]
MSAVDLARLQFALLAATHFLFVLLTLGLGPVVAVLGTRWAVTGREVFERATRFWGQLYLVNYALGIAAGIVLELQFGMHFPGLLDVAGEVFGAPLAVETMVAFFLESTLLGLWVFGWHQLPRWLHATLFWLVVLTGYASAFTVMVANGFLKNPVGYELVDGVAHITDTAALILNPAALVSSLHVLGACLVAGGFVLVGVSASRLRLHPATGGRQRAGRQPADVDEDLWRRSMRAGIATGLVGALLATGAGYAQFTYLDMDDAVAVYPGVVGTSLAVMMGFANLVVLGGWVLALLLIRGALFRLRPRVRNGLFRTLAVLLPAPFVVGILGWLVRELGRQPWVVVGVLRTEDVVSDQPASAVLTSLVVLVGLMVTLAVLDWWVLRRLAARGAEGLVLGAPPGQVLHDDGAGPEDLLRFGAAPEGLRAAPEVVR